MTTENKPKKPAASRKPHLMFGLDVHELSFVSKAGNRRKFITHRSEAPAMPYHADAPARVIEKMRSIDPVLQRHIALNVGKRPVQRKDAGDQASQEAIGEEAMAALQGAARTLASYSDELTVNDLINMAREIGITDASGDNADEGSDDGDGNLDTSADNQTPDDGAYSATDPNPKPATVAGSDIVDRTMQTQKPENVSDADHNAALAQAKAAYDSAIKDTAKRSAEPPPVAVSEQAPAAVAASGDEKPADAKPNAASTLASLTAEQRAEVMALVADATKDLKTRSADVQKQMDAEREQRLQREYAEKAQRYQGLGIPADKISAVLRSAHGNPDQLAGIEQAFQAASEQLNATSRRGGDLFGELGSRQAAPAVGSAEAKLEGLVNSLTERAASSGKTKEQMYRDALRTTEGRQLYSQING